MTPNNCFRLWSLGILLLMGCGGGSSTNTDVPESPKIINFSFTPSPLGYGESIQLKAIFSGGNGTVDQGVGPIQSNFPITVGPLTTNKSFELTVTSVNKQTIKQRLDVNITRNIFSSDLKHLITPRSHGASAILNDGRILFVGGYNLSNASLDSAEVYTPTNGTFEAQNPMNERRSSGIFAVTLETGDVLVAGGGNTGASSEIFNPATKSFIKTSDMVVSRALSQAIRLNNGKVLVTGGIDPATFATFPWTILKSMEIFDPQNGTYQNIGNMISARIGHQLVKLPDGRVMILGGMNTQWIALVTTEIFDPSNNTITAGPNLNIGRIEPAVITDRTNHVWLIGGHDSDIPKDSVEYFDPSLNAFVLIPNHLLLRRAGAFCAMLNDDSILICGGIGGGAGALDNYALTTAERIDTLTKTVIQAGPSQSPHSGGILQKMADGSVLLFGGDDYITTTDTVETFIP